MVILVLIIFIIIILISIFKYKDVDLFSFIISGLFIYLVVVCVIFMLGYPFKVKERLNMYEEENTKIEEKVKNTVLNYMDYESETYTNLIETANLETLLIKYPELNANELVKSEVDLYMENSKEIKTLKEKLITKSIWDWWLKFNIGG